MADWGIKSDGYKTSQQNVLITCHASANTKGSWAQVIASTAFTGYVSVAYTGLALNYAYAVDIGIGEAGSEVVIAANLIFEWTGTYGIATNYFDIPILLPVGTRVAVRGQCTAGGQVAIISVNHTAVSGFTRQPLFSAVDTYGFTAADSGGTAVDPGSTANTAGAWAQFSAACTATYRAIIVAASVGSDQIRSDAYFYVEVGVGAAGSEIILVKHALRSHTAADYILPAYSNLIPVSIPAGTRIAVRLTCNINTDGDRLADVVLHFFR